MHEQNRSQNEQLLSLEKSLLELQEAVKVIHMSSSAAALEKQRLLVQEERLHELEPEIVRRRGWLW